jgi:hypothetical protein
MHTITDGPFNELLDHPEQLAVIGEVTAWG